jgi:S1-C subfamily serine protease
VSDSPHVATPEEWAWKPAATTATMPPSGLEWVIPGGPGEPGGPSQGTIPGPYPSTPPEPPPRRRRGLAGLALVIALMTLAAYFLGGRLQSSPNANIGFGGGGTSFVPTPAAPQAPSGSSTLSSDDVSSIAAKVTKSVVDIDTELGFGSGEAAGTGMILTSSGEVLTNNHVIDGATKITATVVDTGRSYTARVVGTDPTEDVAVIQLEGASGLTPITPAKPSSVAIGDPVVALGNAGGRGGTPSTVTGTVVALGQSITASDQSGGDAQELSDLIEVDAPIEPGDSGGPLANASGQVIGMDSAAEVSGRRFRATTSAGYAIPIEKAVSIAHEIEAGKASSTVHIGLPGFLGVEVATDSQAAGSGGAPLTGVEPGTPASAIGLTAGDTITSINGQPVDSPSALTTLLHAAHPGDQVTVGWTDSSGSKHSSRATLVAGPAD